MKQVIPFEYEVDFKTNIASITSISLEHEENIKMGEVSGNFIVYGNYKEQNDTTEEELFKKRIPFTAILSDDINLDSVSVDINNFTYEIIDNKKLKVNIDYLLMGDKMVVVPDEIVEDREPVQVEELLEEEKVEEEKKEIKDTFVDDDYITYKIHIVCENETIEEIIKKYDTNLETIKNYNDISNIKLGDKILIPSIIND